MDIKLPAIATKINEHYPTLSELEQIILHIYVVHYGEVTLNNLSDLTRTVNDSYRDAANYYSSHVKPLVKIGFIEKKSTTNWCNREVANYFVWSAHFNKTWAKKIASALRITQSWTWTNEAQLLMAWRDVRNQYFEDDTVAFNNALLRLMGTYSLSFEKVLKTICPFENISDLEDKMNSAAFFELAKMNVSFRVSEQKSFSKELDVADSAITKLSDEKRREAHTSLSFFHIVLEGDWNYYKSFADEMSPYEVAALQGFMYLISGNLPHAKAAFDTSLTFTRKATGNRKMTNLLAYWGSFQLLVELMLPTEQTDANLTERIRYVIKKYNDMPVFGMASLSAINAYNNNDQSQAKQWLNRSKQDFFDHFLHPFAVYWAQEDFFSKTEVLQLARNLLNNSYYYPAAELFALLHRYDPADEHIKKLYAKATEAFVEFLPEGITWKPIAEQIPKVEAWQLALNNLLRFSSDRKTTEASLNAKRMAWFVDFSAGEATAKEQVFGKNGWSGGRNIAMTRLKSGELTFMSDQDRRVANKIEVEYGGWYNESDYEYGKAIPELVGHPYLFLSKSPDVAIQFTEVKPKILIKENKDGYEFSLSHPYKETALGYSVLKETPSRYALIRYTPDFIKVAKALDNKSLKVPQQAKNQVIQVLQSISGMMEVESNLQEDLDKLPSVPSDARVHVHLLPVGDGFHIELYTKPFGEVPPYCPVAEGEPVQITDLNGIRTVTKRNFTAEKRNKTILLDSVETLRDNAPRKGIWEIEDAETCLNLLVELSPQIEQNKVVLEWPKGEKFRLSKVIGFDSLSMKVSSQQDWFGISGEIRIDENTVWTMQQLLALSENTKSQFVELSPGKFLALTKEFRRRLQQINAVVSPNKKGELQIHPLAIHLLDDFAKVIPNAKFDKKWKESVQRLREAFAKQFVKPDNLKATLRTYQQEGYEWLCKMADWGVGACLADDMGLGKTVQGLALLLTRASLGPALVVAPASVCRNWVAETQKFAPSLRTILFGEGDRAAAVEQATQQDIVITTYDLMTRESEIFSKKHFATIILDEAQAIKNRMTKRSDTAMSLQADFKVVMSGTPIENHLGELWNLFQFINPGLLGSIEYFTNKFSMPIEKYQDQSRRDQLRRLVQPFMLRRRKDEVLKELPAKTEITLAVELSKEERAFYEALRRNALKKLETETQDDGAGTRHLKILAEIMRLRRACCNPRLVDEDTFVSSSKLAMFEEIVDELIDNGHKALVFSQFVGHLEILANHLAQKGVKYQYLDGQTPLPTRQKRIEAFQSGEGDIFLISLKAGGTGLNLTAADYVIHMDPWWNPAVEDQATDRAHRIGQEKPVTVYRLVTQDTIEEKIITLHEHKRDIADSLLSGTDVSSKLSADQLLDLIKL